MIEPWQVWLADLEPTEGNEQAGKRPVLVISSDLHLQLGGGRMATITPITSSPQSRRYRVPIRNHAGDDNWVITDQIRTISTARFLRTTPWWVLSGDEIDRVAYSLRQMVDL